MNDIKKTKAQLIAELAELRKRTTGLESLEKESQLELSVIFDNAPILMILVDSERRVRKANRAAINFSGRPYKEMIGLRGGDALRCLHSLDDPKGCGFGPFCKTCNVRHTVLDTFDDGKSRFQEEAMLPFSIEGKEENRYLLVTTAPLTILDSNLVLVSIQDITERKKAEEALRKSEERLKRFMESATDSIALFDSKFNLIYINESALKIMNCKRNEAIGKNITELSPDLKKTYRYIKYLEVLKTEKPFECEDIVRFPGKSELYLSIKAFKVGDGLGLLIAD